MKQIMNNLGVLSKRLLIGSIILDDNIHYDKNALTFYVEFPYCESCEFVVADGNIKYKLIVSRDGLSFAGSDIVVMEHFWKIMQEIKADISFIINDKTLKE